MYSCLKSHSTWKLNSVSVVMDDIVRGFFKLGTSLRQWVLVPITEVAKSRHRILNFIYYCWFWCLCTIMQWLRNWLQSQLGWVWILALLQASYLSSLCFSFLYSKNEGNNGYILNILNNKRVNTHKVLSSQCLAHSNSSVNITAAAFSHSSKGSNKLKKDFRLMELDYCRIIPLWPIHSFGAKWQPCLTVLPWKYVI